MPLCMYFCITPYEYAQLEGIFRAQKLFSGRLMHDDGWPQTRLCVYHCFFVSSSSTSPSQHIELSQGNAQVIVIKESFFQWCFLLIFIDCWWYLIHDSSQLNKITKRHATLQWRIGSWCLTRRAWNKKNCFYAYLKMYFERSGTAAPLLPPLHVKILRAKWLSSVLCMCCSYF